MGAIVLQLSAACFNMFGDVCNTLGLIMSTRHPKTIVSPPNLLNQPRRACAATTPCSAALPSPVRHCEPPPLLLQLPSFCQPRGCRDLGGGCRAPKPTPTPATILQTPSPASGAAPLRCAPRSLPTPPPRARRTLTAGCRCKKPHTRPLPAPSTRTSQQTRRKRSLCFLRSIQPQHAAIRGADAAVQLGRMPGAPRSFAGGTGALRWRRLAHAHVAGGARCGGTRHCTPRWQRAG